MKNILGSLLGLCLAAAGHAQYLETVIPVGGGLRDVLWNPTSNKIYLTGWRDTGRVFVLDGATNQVLAAVAVAGYPTLLCWNSVSNKVYATAGDPDWLSVVDGEGDTLIRKVRMRGYPTWMAFNATMNKLYVLCIGDQAIRVYDGTNDALVDEVGFGDSNTPYNLVWNPASNRVFCASRCDGSRDTVFVIDCMTDAIEERCPVGDAPLPMCWNPANQCVYVVDGDGISVLSPLGDSVIATIPAWGEYMCFAPYPNKIYTASGPVAVLDCDSNVVRGTIPARVMTLVADTILGKVYGSNFYRDSLYVFDARADTLVKAIGMGRHPEALCWNSTDSRVYVVDNVELAVYVIRDTTTSISEKPAGPATEPQVLATVVCGAGWMNLPEPGILMDAAGRRVAEVGPGRARPRLAPGIYFVREAQAQAQAQAQTVRKIVVLK